MDIAVEQVNPTVINDLLHRFFNLPAETHPPIDKIFREKQVHSELIHFCVDWPPESIFPPSLVLKMIPDSSREMLFYQGIHASCLSLPVPRCLGCETNPAACQSYVLLEDLTLSHTDVSDWPDPLPRQAAFALVEALSEFQAALWTKPVLMSQTVDLPEFLRDEPGYQAWIGWLKRDFEIYAAGMGDCLERSQCHVYLEILHLLPNLWETFWKPRLAKGPLPLIHGDLNPRNILYPNHSSGKIVLIDWEAYRRDLPARDLAVLLGLHLCPEFEDALPVLQHYHQQLVKLGIMDYSFDDLLTDYEISLLYEIFTPLKLYAQKGIQDECMIQNSITALNSIREARF